MNATALSPRLQAVFAPQRKKTNFVAFITAGDPDYETSLDILCALPDCGVDIIELGMPFSDPVADGPAIQLSYQRALAQAHTMEKTFALVKAFRARNNKTPIVLMGYYNPILHMGVESFLNQCQQHGVDGLIVVDVPPEEDEEIRQPAGAKNIALVRLLTPTSDNQRIEKIVAHASGFLYYVSVLGITGSRHIDLAAVERAMARLRKKINLPIVVGFGITKKEEAAALKNMVDGVVVGSSIVRVIGDGVAVGTNKKTIVAMVQDKVKDIASGLA